MHKRKLNILIFSIGVIMLLLRPYLIYQLSGQKLANDPVKAYNLLQRLIKKKDEHHELSEIVATEGSGFTFVFRLLTNPVSGIYAYICALLFFPYALAGFNFMRNLFQKRPQNRQYLLVSCLQI